MSVNNIKARKRLTDIRSTSIVFQPDNPPAQTTPDVLTKRTIPIQTPKCIKPYPVPQISAACSCLNLPVPTSTVSRYTTVPSTLVIQATSTISSTTTIIGSASTIFETAIISQTSVNEQLTTITASTTTATITNTATVTDSSNPTSCTTVYP